MEHKTTPDVLRRATGTFTAPDEGTESRTLTLSFSSEEPYRRWRDAAEILDHAPDAVALERVNEIGCVLFNHNRDRPIGKIDRAWIEDGRGMAEITLDTDAESEIIFNKVKSGTLRAVSVSYHVDVWEKVRADAESTDRRFKGPAMVARKWTPLEISIVSVPADATIGVGRAEGTPQHDIMGGINGVDVTNTITAGTEEEMRNVENAAAKTIINIAAQQETAPNQTEARDDVAAERQRVADIVAICARSNMEATDYIQRGDSVETVLRAANDALIASAKPVTAPTITADEGDKFRDAASDAALIRAGLEPEQVSEGARQLAGMSLRDLLIECGTRSGIAGAHRLDTDELMRQFYNPTSAFPQIMEQTIRKAYVKGYDTVPTTFEQWTMRGTLSDFKSTTGGYLMGTAGEFLRVPENGEIKHDLPVDTVTPTRKLETYARQFTMSRQAIINDDIGYLASIPARYAQSAKRTINRHVYAILTKNPIIYDGNNLFDALHDNVINPGEAPSVASLVNMIQKMMLRTNDANETLMIAPRYLVVPVGLGLYLRMLLDSDTIKTTNFANGEMEVRNPLTGYTLRVVEDAELNSNAAPGEEFAWYMIGDPSTVGTVQVDYYNGQTTPTIRRSETPGQLGYIWDIYLDWGVSVLDWRGLIKNVGAKPASL